MTLLLLLAALGANTAPLKVINGRLYVEARVNHVVTEALLDSGAEMSLVDPRLAEVAKIDRGEAVELKGTGGTAKARFASGVRIGALDVEMADRDVVVTDLAEVSKRLLRRDTRLVLGREFFDSGRFRLDFGRGRIDRLSSDHKPVGTRLTLTTRNGIEEAPVTLGGIEVRAAIDLGNGSHAIVSRGLANRLGLPSIGKAHGGGIGGTRERHLVILPPLVIAGKTIRGVKASVDEDDAEEHLNVGTQQLGRFLVTTDFPDRAIYLAAREAGR